MTKVSTSPCFMTSTLFLFQQSFQRYMIIDMKFLHFLRDFCVCTRQLLSWSTLQHVLDLMKIIHLLIAFFLLSTVQTVLAQEVTDKASIEWCNDVQMKRKSTLDDFIGTDDEHYYTLMKERGDLFILKFTHDLRLVQKQELPMHYGKNYHYFQFMVMQGSELYLFTKRFVSKEKSIYLYVEHIDKKTLQSVGGLKEVVVIPATRKWNTVEFDHSISIDEKKMVLDYNMPYEYDTKEEAGVIVFDEKMNVMWSKVIELPYMEQSFAVEKLRVDNDGDVYVVGRHFKTPRESRMARREGVPSFTYKVFAVQKQGGKMLEFDINGDDKFITDLSVVVSDKKEIIAAGFYSDLGSWSIKGSIFIRIDGNTGKVVKSSFKAFSYEFIRQGLSERQAARVDRRKEKRGVEPELYEYDLKSLLVRDDGGCVMIAEQYYVRVTTHTMYNPNGSTTTTTTYHYYYNDILVVNINPDGVIDWNSRIKKRQYSTNDHGRYSSYTMAVVKDRLFFIFNDDPRNLHIPESAPVYSADFGRTAVVTLAQVTADGKVSREALHYNEGENTNAYTVPKVSEQISQNELVLFAKGRKWVRFAKVKFK